MRSLPYYVAKVPGLRKYLKWSNSRRLDFYRQKEQTKMQMDPQNLMNFEKKIFSQNGEDGILGEIFRRIGTTNKYFVEFGIEDGSESNGRYLLEKQSWSGFWMDGSAENVQRSQKNFAPYPIQIQDCFITKENIVALFEAAKVPSEPDLLSIDIDGNDYWVWQELQTYKARVVCIEYNASYLPDEHWIMPYNPKHLFQGTAHFGASLLAYEILGKQLGYTLVSCDQQGVNAFFVRDDLIGNHFTHTDGGASYHYTAPKFRGLFFGHPK